MKPSLARNPDLARNHGDDARAEELEHLKLALATFAVQLDAFEMRTHGLRLAAGNPGIPSQRPTAAVDLGRTT